MPLLLLIFPSQEGSYVPYFRADLNFDLSADRGRPGIEGGERLHFQQLWSISDLEHTQVRLHFGQIHL